MLLGPNILSTSARPTPLRILLTSGISRDPSQTKLHNLLEAPLTMKMAMIVDGTERFGNFNDIDNSNIRGVWL